MDMSVDSNHITVPLNVMYELEVFHFSQECLDILFFRAGRVRSELPEQEYNPGHANDRPSKYKTLFILWLHEVLASVAVSERAQVNYRP